MLEHLEIEKNAIGLMIKMNHFKKKKTFAAQTVECFFKFREKTTDRG